MVDTEEMRCWAEIDLAALENNYRRLRALLPPGCRFLGVIKADAYGHGAVPVARRLEALGAEYLAVAFLDEALALRQAGIGLPILILGHIDPAFTPLLIQNRLTQTVVSLEAARSYSAAALARGGRLRCHLKVDSGMGRLGFTERETAELAEAAGLEGLEVEGVYTHFAAADEPDCGYTERQLAQFLRICAQLEAACGRKIPIRHCAASSGVLNYPQSCLEMVRPGIALYGHFPAEKTAQRPALEPVMRLKCRVMQLKHMRAGESVSYGRTWTAQRDSRIAVLGIGYGDGLHRVLSNRASVYIGGARAPIVGRVCMDMTMVDVTDLHEVRQGDVAEIFGAHLPVEEQAALCDTISYELLCTLAPRVPRIYLG